jgi:hypothetical protein
MTSTEGREPSGLAVESLSRVLGDVRRYCDELVDCSTTFEPLRALMPCIAFFG